MTRVVIGMDPHKRSVTIEVMGPDETVLDFEVGDELGGDPTAGLAGGVAWPDLRPCSQPRLAGLGSGR